MSADELRNWYRTCPPNMMPDTFMAMVLCEIAAQLAEANEKLNKLHEDNFKCQ